jgi:hypothetical protein
MGECIHNCAPCGSWRSNRHATCGVLVVDDCIHNLFLELAMGDCALHVLAAAASSPSPWMVHPVHVAMVRIHIWPRA